MQNDVETTKSDNPSNEDWKEYRSTLGGGILLPEKSSPIEDQDTFKSFEDIERFAGNLFTGREFLPNEQWDDREVIQGLIVHFNDQEIFVDCLVDIDNHVFEQRIFPRYFFSNISDLAANKPVIINTRAKPGSIRLDVYPGEGMVDLDLFKSKDVWDKYEGAGLDDKLTEWLD